MCRSSGDFLVLVVVPVLRDVPVLGVLLEDDPVLLDVLLDVLEYVLGDVPSSEVVAEVLVDL
jgi:hypothetical protein